jgi:hypothetical protein
LIDTDECIRVLHPVQTTMIALAALVVIPDDTLAVSPEKQTVAFRKGSNPSLHFVMTLICKTHIKRPCIDYSILTSWIRFALKCLTIHCRNSEWHVFNRSPAISVLNGVFEEEPAERVLVEVLDVLARDVDIGAVIEVDPVHVVLGHLLDIDIQGFALDRI